jgi:hypothetical protein
LQRVVLLNAGLVEEHTAFIFTVEEEANLEAKEGMLQA